MADDSERQEDSAQPSAGAAGLAEQADAEATEAEALAEAARARARAVRLRQQADSAAEAARTDETDTEENDTRAAEGDETDTAAGEADETDTRPADVEPARQLRKPQRATVLTAAMIVAICALLGVSGYIALQHHAAMQHRQRVAAFTAAAKQGVINIATLNFQHAEDDIRRLLDSSTGEFKDDFERQAADFIKVAKQAQVVSEGTVDQAAVESMDTDSAVVLVSATSKITNAAGAKEEPRAWRLRVTVTQDGDQIKMSNLVYVP
jgi:Mce-associated membrane protein